MLDPRDDPLPTWERLHASRSRVVVRVGGALEIAVRRRGAGFRWITTCAGRSVKSDGNYLLLKELLLIVSDPAGARTWTERMRGRIVQRVATPRVALLAASRRDLSDEDLFDLIEPGRK